MKKCPSCEKTYEDSMRFCQIDGTPLVDDEPPVDPFKTMVVPAASLPVVAESEPVDQAPPVEAASATIAQPTIEPPAPAQPTFEVEAPAQPTFEPPAPAQPTFEPGVSAINEPDEVLDLPGANDPLKTMYVSEEEMRQALAGSPAELELTPDPPEFIASELTASESAAAALPFEQPSVPVDEPTAIESSPAAAFDASIPPIPSPFDASPVASIEPIGSSESEEPSFNESETMIQPPASPHGEPQPFGATPHQDFAPAAEPEQVPSQEPPPFKEPEPFSPAIAVPAQEQQSPAAWTPPPAPDASWQNQEIGSNTPFQPPPAGTGGQNKTLAIVSLVIGIVSALCCSSVFLVGIAAIVTGFMAKGKASSNPEEYGGTGMAWAGIILGGVSLLFGAAYWLLILSGAIKLPGGF